MTPALDEAEQIRRVYEREANNYDRNVRLPERLLFAGGMRLMAPMTMTRRAANGTTVKTFHRL